MFSRFGNEIKKNRTKEKLNLNEGISLKKENDFKEETRMFQRVVGKKDLLVIACIMLSLVICITEVLSKEYGEYIGDFMGVNAYSRGNKKIAALDNDYQCVEYVNSFYSQAMHHPTASSWSGDARTYFETAGSKSLSVYYNGGNEIPKAGDILCFDDSNAGAGRRSVVDENGNTKIIKAYGHVAIIMSTEKGKEENGTTLYNVNLIEQNVSIETAYRSQAMQKHADGTFHFANWSGYTVQGWLRMALNPNDPSFQKFRDLVELYLNSPYPNTRYFNGKARDLVGNPLYEQRENGNKYQDYWSFLIPTDKGWSLCITYTPGAVPSEDKYLAPYPVAIHPELVDFYKANRSSLGSALCDTILGRFDSVIELDC